MCSIQLIEAYNLLGNESDQSHHNCSKGKKDAMFICNKIARAAYPSRRQNSEHLARGGAMD